MDKITRREFIKQSTILGIGAVGSFVLGKGDIFASKESIDVVAVTGKDIDKIVEKAIDTLGGIKSFISKGDIVMIKPNIGWARTMEQAANTNPYVLKKIVEMCYEAGAKKVKITDRPCNKDSITFSKSGIKDVCEKVGAEVKIMDYSKFKKVKIGGKKIKYWEVYPDIIEADKLINVPIAKHHSSSKLTLAMKNWFGAVGGSRGQLHQDLDQSIADLAYFFKPQLNIIDAVRILVRNGPTGGNLKDVKKIDTVIASKSQVAADAYATTLFNMTPEDIDYIKLGYELGLGEYKLNKLNIKKIAI